LRARQSLPQRKIISGETLLVVEDVDSKARVSTTLQTGDLAFIPTRIAHALRPVHPGHAIEFSSARFDATDVHRFPLL
jgi:hypothetical protein